ncbi:MAG: glycosyltransferase family 4 protein, partial [Flavobacteriaceae bacterium]
LCMVGPEKDGSLAACEKYAKEKKLPVQFAGKLAKKKWISLSKDFSIFINTTNFDNTPISVIEAMALGLPIVSTDVGGIPFLLKDNHVAVLVPPQNPGAFTNGIKKLLNDEALANRLRANARRKAEMYDWQKVKEQWHLLLK